MYPSFQELIKPQARKVITLRRYEVKKKVAFKKKGKYK